MAGAKEVRSVDGVAGGKVGFCDDWHAETPTEASADVGCVATPVLYVVEPLHGEMVGFRVDSDKVGVTH